MIMYRNQVKFGYSASFDANHNMPKTKLTRRIWGPEQTTTDRTTYFRSENWWYVPWWYAPDPIFAVSKYFYKKKNFNVVTFSNMYNLVTRSLIKRSDPYDIGYLL